MKYKNNYTSSNGITITLQDGMCFECQGKHYCPHSDSDRGKAITEFLKKYKRRCSVIARLEKEEKNKGGKVNVI